jgi:succinate dehydrogenase / fumarate reductase flavoprotein subunit
LLANFSRVVGCRRLGRARVRRTEGHGGQPRGTGKAASEPPRPAPPAAGSLAGGPGRAAAADAEVKEGRGSPYGGVFLDIGTRRDAEYIKRRLPSMYHQFMQLADVDITKEPMEVGPTCHYVMGGVRVDPDTQEGTVPGLFAAGEAANDELWLSDLASLSVVDRRKLDVCAAGSTPGRRQGTGLTVSRAGNAPGVAGFGAGRFEPARLRRAVMAAWCGQGAVDVEGELEGIQDTGRA